MFSSPDVRHTVLFFAHLLAYDSRWIHDFIPPNAHNVFPSYQPSCLLHHTPPYVSSYRRHDGFSADLPARSAFCDANSLVSVALCALSSSATDPDGMPRYWDSMGGLDPSPFEWEGC
jgi:hypothetical protein